MKGNNALMVQRRFTMPGIPGAEEFEAEWLGDAAIWRLVFPGWADWAFEGFGLELDEEVFSILFGNELRQDAALRIQRALLKRQEDKSTGLPVFPGLTLQADPGGGLAVSGPARGKVRGLHAARRGRDVPGGFRLSDRDRPAFLETLHELAPILFHDAKFTPPELPGFECRLMSIDDVLIGGPLIETFQEEIEAIEGVRTRHDFRVASHRLPIDVLPAVTGFLQKALDEELPRQTQALERDGTLPLARDLIAAIPDPEIRSAFTISHNWIEMRLPRDLKSFAGFPNQTPLISAHWSRARGAFDYVFQAIITEQEGRTGVRSQIKAMRRHLEKIFAMLDAEDPPRS